MAFLLLSYIWLWEGAFPGNFTVVLAAYFGIGFLGHRQRGESLRDIGLRLDNFRPALRNAAPVVGVAVPVILIAGAALDGWHFPSWTHAAITLPASAAWGTAQQYGLLCVFYRRLHELLGSAAAATVGAALIFSFFHLPNGFLMAVTLVAGAVACMLYRREPNVPAIGVIHAVVSFTLYYALPYDVTTGLRVGPGYFADG